MIRSVLGVITACLMTTASFAEEMKLAVTTSFHNSGLSDVLLPEIEKDLGLTVHLLVVGTGQALRLGAAGDVDAILVHSKASEEAFVAAGHGPHRTEIMYNDFVIVGPSTDPARIKTTTSADAALRAIEAKTAPFVSRGDDSGTHKKELSLWSEAGLNAETFDPSWYRAAGAGMGASLNVASGMNAYILSDRASWLKFGNKGDLDMLFSGDPVLFNQYAYLPVSAQKHPHVDANSASLLESWLVSARAKGLINDYRLNGEALFTFNAK